MQHDLQPHRRGGLALFLQILKHTLQEAHLHQGFAIYIDKVDQGTQRCKH